MKGFSFFSRVLAPPSPSPLTIRKVMCQGCRSVAATGCGLQNVETFLKCSCFLPVGWWKACSTGSWHLVCSVSGEVEIASTLKKYRLYVYRCINHTALVWEHFANPSSLKRSYKKGGSLKIFEVDFSPPIHFRLLNYFARGGYSYT